MKSSTSIPRYVQKFAKYFPSTTEYYFDWRGPVQGKSFTMEKATANFIHHASTEQIIELKRLVKKYESA